MGLIFLRYADQKFSEAEKKLTAAGSGRRKIGKTDYQAQGMDRVGKFSKPSPSLTPSESSRKLLQQIVHP